MRDLSKRLQVHFQDEFHQHKPLAKFTSARVGGNAALFVIAHTKDELKLAAKLADEYSIPYFVLGSGSNILLSDAGVHGLVIQNRCKHVQFRRNGVNSICTADSGTNISSLARQCVNKGLSGLEWAVSVPGTVGGAVFGNSGAHGSDTNANLLSATVWDPEKGIFDLTNDDMLYAYRDSAFKQDVREGRPRRVILSADFELVPEKRTILEVQAEEYVTHRKKTQPAGATMGSMFKNPANCYAGHLIDRAGLKGKRMGGVHISEKHANFFINDDNATAKDIVNLLDFVSQQIYDEFNIELEPEVELVGNWYFTEKREDKTEWRFANSEEL